MNNIALVKNRVTIHEARDISIKFSRYLIEKESGVATGKAEAKYLGAVKRVYAKIAGKEKSEVSCEDAREISEKLKPILEYGSHVDKIGDKKSYERTLLGTGIGFGLLAVASFGMMQNAAGMIIGACAVACGAVLTGVIAWLGSKTTIPHYVKALNEVAQKIEDNVRNQMK